MIYRKEIDGLRALAVLPVIFFHAGFPMFGGGYVGVDVFFVISGFLITSIILTEKGAGTFTLANFYERRARRILPALFFVMSMSLVFAWMWLTPSDLIEFSKSLVAVSTFSSNILFWRESGYWGVETELVPLLHTWSLAVEEQFYVLFPLFLLLMWRFKARWILGSFLVISASSLIIAQWGAFNFPTATFFLLPSRAWELGIGAIIAVPFQYNEQAIVKVRANKHLSELLSLVAVLMISYSILAFDHTTPFPSAFALVPTVAAGLLIVFGSSDTFVGKVLGTKPLVRIGLISYSAYLWHQVLFALARNHMIPGPSDQLLLMLAMLSLALAYLTWAFVERPFRAKGKISRRAIFSLAIGGSVLFLSLGISGYVAHGYENRFVQPEQLSASFGRSARSKECFDFPYIHESDTWKCAIGGGSQDPVYFVLGDSHALSMLDAFDKAGRQNGISGYFSGASRCLPFLETYILDRSQNRRNCNSFNERVFDFVSSTAIEHLILIARWTYYTDGGYDGKDFSFVGLSDHAGKSKSTSRAAFEKGLRAAVERYNSIGVNVTVIRQVPQQLSDPRRIYHNAYLDDDPLGRLHDMSVSKAEHDSLQAYVDSQFRALQPDNIRGRVGADFQYIDLASTMCDGKCMVGTGIESYYVDADHLSVKGTNQIARRASDLLEELLSERGR